MTFAQRRNRRTTDFSESIPVVKRRKSVLFCWKRGTCISLSKCTAVNRYFKAQRICYFHFPTESLNQWAIVHLGNLTVLCRLFPLFRIRKGWFNISKFNTLSDALLSKARTNKRQFLFPFIHGETFTVTKDDENIKSYAKMGRFLFDFALWNLRLVCRDILERQKRTISPASPTSTVSASVWTYTTTENPQYLLQKVSFRNYITTNTTK